MRTLVVIPSRYEPRRLARLLKSIREDVLVLDNGHEPALKADPVVDTRSLGLHAQWNLGRRWAAEHGYEAVALLNDDVTVEPGLIGRLVEVLASDASYAVTYPGELQVGTDPAGPYRMTGYCFAFRLDLPLPPFDEGFAWWYGDTAFERGVLQAGYAVVGVPDLRIEHTSDSEANDWARRPELKALAAQDAERWEAML